MELDTVLPITAPLEPGQTYRIIANGRETTTFTLPAPDLRDTFIAESPIESAEVVVAGSAPPSYELRVVSGRPRGSGCSQFNGYEIRRGESNRIDVVITHHQVADTLVACTADYPVVETTVPLGSDFEPGVELHRSPELGHHRVIWWPFALSAKPAGSPASARPPHIAAGVARIRAPAILPACKTVTRAMWATSASTACCAGYAVTMPIHCD